jgi:hypothetical protein
VVDIAVEVVGDHARSLRGEHGRPAKDVTVLPPATEWDLDNLGLNRIADMLLRPIQSGVWLSRRDLARVSTDVAVPAGFGDRSQILRNLLRNAAEYDTAPSVIRGIDAVVEQRARATWALGTHLDTDVSPWLTRMHHTREALSAMTKELARVGEREPVTPWETESGAEP